MHIGDDRTEPAEVTVYQYSETGFEECTLQDPEDCAGYLQQPGTTWVAVKGVHDAQIIEEIGKGFQLHPLVLEDIMNTGQRPKVDEFDDYLYIVLRAIFYDEALMEIRTEQISIVLGRTFVLTFLETENSIWQPVVEGLRRGRGNLRKMGPDYLAFLFLDIVVDRYFIALEQLGEDIEETEEKLVSDPSPDELHDIHRMKKGMLILRRSVWPLREAVGSLERGHTNLIQDSTRIYYRDVYDHTIQVIDTAETYRDIVSGMLDIYLSSVSNRMNEVMKVLTIIATIFIPLTFLTGVYGMNFKFMPELDWHDGYLIVWGIMVSVAVVQLILFRIKKWI